MAQPGSRTTETSKMEPFKTIFDGFYSATIVTKSSILDPGGSLDPLQAFSHFRSCRIELANSNDKEDDLLL